MEVKYFSELRTNSRDLGSNMIVHCQKQGPMKLISKTYVMVQIEDGVEGEKAIDQAIAKLKEQKQCLTKI